MTSKELSWENDIRKNLSELTRSITNLDTIFIQLLEHDIISYEEMETIQKECTTGSKQNLKLLYTLRSKNWCRVRSLFLQILRDTTNDHCANIIEAAFAKSPSKSSKQSNRGNESNSSKKSLPKLLKNKWWPEEKILSNSFYKRKNENDELFTEKLKRLLIQNENKTTVINQKVAVSGLGGIGKSTTAKWFAKEYEKDYDFILWIDCGEGSLLKSFTSLARILEVKHRRELELKELAAGCFQHLKDKKCLFIYDNAECYVGVEGIRDVLPISYSNFHVIITSRNREWGNESGLGQIQEFQLDTFHDDEALEFMKRNLRIQLDEDEPKLEKLCELLGNLPLALQIAVATLNQKKIPLTDYIERIKDTEHIILTTFDDYEKTINKTMQISLNLIQSHERNVGGLAYRIVTTFGYITPDDVELKFIQYVEKEFNNAEIIEATELLESFSLITSKSITPQRQQFSIHRLLQQVIRQFTLESKNEILRKILRCKQFLKYKLIPFSYAGKELQMEFSQIKAELIDKLELIQLLKERKFAEALELSRLIKDTLNNLTSRFNYGMCLKYNSDDRKSMEVFESLFYDLKENVNNTPEEESFYKEYFNQFGIIYDENKELTLEVILGQILLGAKYKEEANILFLILKRVILPISTPHNEIVTFLNSMSFSNYTCRYLGQEHYVSLSMESEGNTNEFELSSYVVDKTFHLPKDLQKLTLEKVKLMDTNIKWNVPKLYLKETDFVENMAEITVKEMEIIDSTVNTYLLPQSLQMLTIEECYLVKNLANAASNISPLPHLKYLNLSLIDPGIIVKNSNVIEFHSLDFLDYIHLLLPSLTMLSIKGHGLVDTEARFSPICIPLKRLKLIKHLILEKCNLIVPRDFIPIELQTLILLNVNIRDELDNDYSSMLVNDFINFSHMQTLHLQCMSIDFSEDVTIDEVGLYEMNQVLNWENGKWKITKLILGRFHDFSRTEIIAKEMTIHNSKDVHISHLPQTLEKLILGGHTSISCSTSSAGNNVPSWPSCLKILIIEPDVKFLDAGGEELKEFDISATLPKSLNKLSINCYSNSEKDLEMRSLFGNRLSDNHRCVYLNHLQSLDILQLNDCDLIYFPTIVTMHIAPKTLRLWDVNIIDGNTNQKVDIPLNDFIDFNRMQKLELKGQIVDFCKSFNIKDVHLHDTKLINWENGRWTIDNLHIKSDPGPTTNTVGQSKYGFSSWLLEGGLLKLIVNECNKMEVDEIENGEIEFDEIGEY